MDWLDVIEARLNKALEGIVTLFFFCIFCLTVLLVVMRYGFNSSLIWGSEAMNYLFIYTTALGAAVSVSKGTHIRISFLVDYTRGRVRKCIDLLVFFLIGGVNAMLCWYSLPWIKAVGSFESPVMRIPMRVVQVTVPLGCALACIYCLFGMIRIIMGHEEKTC